MNALFKKTLVIAVGMTIHLHGMEHVLGLSCESNERKTIAPRSGEDIFKAIVESQRNDPPIRPIKCWQDIKIFTGHVVAFEVAPLNEHIRTSQLTRYGFISQKGFVEVYSYYYKLCSLSNGDQKKLAFSWNTQQKLWQEQDLFMRHVSPQEARTILDEYFVKKDVDDIAPKVLNIKSFQYFNEMHARLYFRAQQRVDESPSLYVFLTQQNKEELNSLAPEKAQEFLNAINNEREFHYYVTANEKIEIEGILMKIINRV